MDRLDKIEKYWKLNHQWTHPSYDQLKADVIDLVAFVREVESLHYAAPYKESCVRCYGTWPCYTRQAIDRLNGGGS
jgi:hypothetical protein